MQVKVTSADHAYQREIEIDITKEEIQPIVDKEKKKIRNQSDVPGFRKGKAPQHLVDKYYGKALHQEVIDHVINDYYPKALDEVNLNPVMQGEIKNLNYEKVGSPLSFSVYVEVEPEIKVKDFSKIKFEKSIRSVKDEDVNRFIADIREKHGVAESIEGPVAENDIVVMDVTELDENDRPNPKKSYKDIRIQIGKGQFDPEIEKDIIGTKTNEIKHVRRAYPSDFEDAALAGKDEKFQISVKRIERLDLPEFNDAFVKDLGKYENVDDYKKQLWESFEKQYKHDADHSLLHDIIHKLSEKNPFDLPDGMIERELDVLYVRATSYGEKVDEKVFRQYYRQTAEENVRWHIIRKSISEKAEIEINDEEIRSFLVGEGWKEDQIDKEITNHYLKEQVEESLLQKKVIDYITGKAKVVDKNITPKTEKKKATAKK